METSDNVNKWNYMIKNLIILDRCVEEKLFLYDIMEMKIYRVENYKDPEPKISKKKMIFY
jgi:hypothetical protein